MELTLRPFSFAYRQLKVRDSFNYDKERSMKPIIALVLAVLISGCASVSSDMKKNNFPLISAQEPSDDLVGFWTGAMTSYLATLQLEDDGTGTLCYSWGTANVEQKVKYRAGIVNIQDGTSMLVDNISKEQLALKSEYFTGAQFTYVRDDNLTEASAFCSSVLSK
jgi:hypothetical protein